MKHGEVILHLIKFTQLGDTTYEHILDLPTFYNWLNTARAQEGQPQLNPSGFRRLINRCVLDTPYWKNKIQRELLARIKVIGRRKWGFQVALDAERKRTMVMCVEDIQTEYAIPEATPYYHAFEWMRNLGYANSSLVPDHNLSVVAKAKQINDRVSLMHGVENPIGFSCWPIDYLHTRSPAIYCNERIFTLTGVDHTKEFTFTLDPRCGEMVLYNTRQARPGEIVSFGKVRITGLNVWMCSFGFAVRGLLFLWGFMVPHRNFEAKVDIEYMFREVFTCAPAQTGHRVVPLPDATAGDSGALDVADVFEEATGSGVNGANCRGGSTVLGDESGANGANSRGGSTVLGDGTDGANSRGGSTLLPDESGTDALAHFETFLPGSQEGLAWVSPPPSPKAPRQPCPPEPNDFSVGDRLHLEGQV